MRSYPIACRAWIFILLGSLLGCADTDPPPPTEELRPARKPTQAKIDVAQLPKLGNYMSGLDNDRLEVAPPEGWILGLRSKGYLVRFLPSDQQQYPMILVTGEDYQGPADVSPQNVDQFARRIKTEDSVGGRVEPIEIGRFVGVTYRKRGKEPRTVNKILERLLVVTVVAGRKYGVELRAREGRIDESKQSLFAVVNGIRFTTPPAETDDKKAANGETKASPDDSQNAAREESQKKTQEKSDPDREGLDKLLN